MTEALANFPDHSPDIHKDGQRADRVPESSTTSKGRTTMSRRKAFFPIAAVPLMGASIAVGVGEGGAAFAKSRVKEESPKLIALYARLKNAELDLQAANSAKKTALAAYNQASKPVLPSELIQSDDDALCFINGRREVDIGGNYADPDRKTCRYIITSSILEMWAEDYGPRSKYGRLIRQRLKIACDYERRLGEVIDRTGIKRAFEARAAVIARIDALVKEIADVPARTEQGLFIKSQAILAYDETMHSHKMLALINVGPSLIKDIQVVLSAHAPDAATIEATTSAGHRIGEATIDNASMCTDP